MYEFANYFFFFFPQIWNRSSLTISASSFFGCLCVCLCLVSPPPALPHYKLFETQAQLIVVTEEFGIRRDLIQKHLRHLQRALRKEKEAGDKNDKNKDAGLDGEKEKLS